MAHEIEMVNGVAQMAYAGDTPWHGLGERVSNDLTPEQMMKKAGLNWDVNKQDIYYGESKYQDITDFRVVCDESNNTAAVVDRNEFIADIFIKPARSFGQGQVIPGKKALVRSSDSKLLDIVGDDWNPVQNSEAFKFFSEYVLAGDMEMHTAGSLKEGKNVFALAKVKESFTILGDDQVDSYLLFSNPHQYGKCIDVRFTPIRVVCNNTLTMSLNESSKNQVKLNHRSVFDAETVKTTMGIAHDKFAKYKEMAEFLSTKKFSVENLISYYNDVFPFTHKANEQITKVEDLSKNAKEAMAVLETQPGAEFGAGTWWQALNSVTYLTDHVMGRSADTRMESAWFGSNQTRKMKAVNKAVEYAAAS